MDLTNPQHETVEILVFSTSALSQYPKKGLLGHGMTLFKSKLDLLEEVENVGRQ